MLLMTKMSKKDTLLPQEPFQNDFVGVLQMGKTILLRFIKSFHLFKFDL